MHNKYKDVQQEEDEEEEEEEEGVVFCRCVTCILYMIMNQLTID